MTLRDQPVLLVDCQSTGASPRQGQVIDVAWQAWPAPEVEQRLVALAEGASVPRAITRLTGLSTTDLAGAPSAEVVAAELAAAAEGRVVVAHFARFERGFLADWLPGVPWICTHEIARRVLSELPRKGLRAVAGYLGSPLKEHKRAADHVAATAVVWAGLLPLLAARGVVDQAGLARLLAEKPPKAKPARERAYRVPRAVRLALPTGPGVYRMLGKGGEVLYVGKATSLKARVNSYFRGRKGQGERKLELITQVWSLDVTETATPLEAALLEADEIKRLAPPYNTALRQRDRTLRYCDLSFEAAPALDGRFAHGPTTSAGALESAAAVVGDQPVVWAWAEDLTEAVAEAGLAQFRAGYGGSPWVVAATSRVLRSLNDAPDDDEAALDEAEPEWTPERVARMARGAVAHAGHSLRRGRWLRWLATAVVRWTPAKGGRRQVVIEAGVMQFSAARGRWPKQAEPEGPPALDVAAYDRLSVLSAELRARVRDGRPVEIRPAGHAPLDSATLKVLFEWVL